MLDGRRSRTADGGVRAEHVAEVAAHRADRAADALERRERSRSRRRFCDRGRISRRAVVDRAARWRRTRSPRSSRRPRGSGCRAGGRPASSPPRARRTSRSRRTRSSAACGCSGASASASTTQTPMTIQPRPPAEGERCDPARHQLSATAFLRARAPGHQLRSPSSSAIDGHEERPHQERVDEQPERDGEADLEQRLEVERHQRRERPGEDQPGRRDHPAGLLQPGDHRVARRRARAACSSRIRVIRKMLSSTPERDQEDEREDRQVRVGVRLAEDVGEDQRRRPERERERQHDGPDHVQRRDHAAQQRDQHEQDQHQHERHDQLRVVAAAPRGCRSSRP